MAAKIGLPASIVQIHNDQYIPTDFQVVLTSIANAFYTTDNETDLFEWTPTKNGTDFLAKLSGMTEINALQSFAYNKMYLATSDELAIKLGSEHRCTRRACPTPDSCGFIPNYPVICFPKDSIIPSRT